MDAFVIIICGIIIFMFLLMIVGFCRLCFKGGKKIRQKIEGK